MNNLDLTHLETLLAAATPGPWEADHNCTTFLYSTEYEIGRIESGQDADLIIALRNAAPALIARVRELEDRQVILEKARLNASQIIASLANDDADLWQPIETAPKDGTRLLVAHASGEIYSAFYSSDFEEWAIVGNSTSRQLTHWKHLPKPPTE